MGRERAGCRPAARRRGDSTEIEVAREPRDALGSKLHSGTSEITRTMIPPLLAQ